MKKLILLPFCLLLMLSNAFSQNVPNGDFENWTSFGFYEEPDFWNTSDSIALALTFGSAHSATKETSDIHGGAFALKLFPFNSPFGVIPGVASNGTLNTSTLAFEGGSPDNVRHQTLNGFYKFTSVSNDSCTIAVSLFRWNGAVKEIIAAGLFGTSASVSSYTPFSFNLAYSSTATPDTMLIAIYSSALGAAHTGTVLLVDDLSFTGVVSGINEEHNPVHSLNVFPVPATSELTVELTLSKNIRTSFEITDLLGKAIIRKEMPAAITSQKIDTRSLSEGTYLYRLLDENENVLRTGRFSVVR